MDCDVVVRKAGRDWPAVGVPVYFAHPQTRAAAIASIVIVTTKPILSVDCDDARMSGAEKRWLRAEKRSSTAIEEIFAIAIQIGSGDGAAAAEADFVGAVCATATLSPVNEQKIICIAPVDECGFDRFIEREGIYRRVWCDAMACLRIKLNQLDAAPE